MAVDVGGRDTEAAVNVTTNKFTTAIFDWGNLSHDWKLVDSLDSLGIKPVILMVRKCSPARV